MKETALPSDYLTVTAPEDSRSKKDQLIWNGNCTYFALRIN